jgi:hypothetical protein
MAYRGFPQSLQAGAMIEPWNKAKTAFFQILSNSSFTYNPLIQCYVILAIEKASLNKLK